ncbi:MAG: lamin tail domain-containing protein, partial [Clostridiales bacterium]|nr:lamin tail domain-containing protein [Clostridiales bacterium]
MGNKPFKRVIAIIISMAMLIACVQVNVFAATVEPHVVINQAYGGGGNSGALYKNDFIELFNPTDSPVDMSGWTVQYASAKGAFGEFITKIPDKTEIKARGFYLIQEAAGDGGTVDLPGPDCTGDIKMGASAFKIALVSNGDAATGLKDPDVVDFLGAGTASAYEGNNAAPAPNAATAVVRKTTGVDTNDNGVDFKTATPEPRDSDSPIVPAAPETKCATPTANPASGNIEAGTKIVFATATAGAEIQYSTTASDGPWTDETDVVVNA